MHADEEKLQLYLAGALDARERQALEAHLSGCERCRRALADLAAEDELLTEALRLDAAERAWIDSVDLVEPFMAQVAPRPSLPLILTGLLLLVAGLLAGSIWQAASGALSELIGMGDFIRLARRLAPELPRLLGWLSRGGLLGPISPLLALGAACGFRHLIRTKETNSHA